MYRLSPFKTSLKLNVMKKILLISSFLLGGFLLAQTSFANNYSIFELENIQKTIPKDQKHDFYKQYFRAKLVSDMKSRFTHKNYSEEILKKFTDSVIAGNTSNELFVNSDNEVFSPSQTFADFLASHENYISQNEDSVKKSFSSIEVALTKGKKEKDQLLAELVSIRMKQINEAKSKTLETLKREYETLIANEKENFENEPYTQRGLEKIINSIDYNFAQQLQHSDENYMLLAQNAGSVAGQYFPTVSSEPNDSAIYEIVPGEIVTYLIETGVAAGRQYITYRIDGDNLTRIYPLDPQNNADFYTKVSKYVKGNWRFENRAGYDIKKDENGEYHIVTSLYTDDDANCCPSMALQYSTKDFQNFVPRKISKKENKWTIIK